MQSPTQPTSTSAHVRKQLNGLELAKMYETIDVLKADPKLAQFQFRARNRWIDGGHNRSTIQDFYGAGQEDSSRQQPFVFDAGEPPLLLGDNEGANPVEFLLHALAGCITTTFILHAAARGIRVNALSAELRGDIDLQGFLGIDGSVFPGYEKIHILLDVDADADDEQIDELLGIAEAHSPTCNTVCQPVPLVVERKR